LQCIGALLAALLCLISSKQQSVSILLVGVGILTFAIGQGIWSFEELVLRQSPFPSMADIAFLLSYGILLPSILRLPKRPLALVARISVVLDAWMIIITIVTVCWQFVLRPVLLLNGSSLLATTIGTAYPCFDLILCVCVLLFWIRQEDRKAHAGLLLLVLGFVTLAVVDGMADYLNIYNVYATGNLIDPLWSLGYQCIAVGVVIQQRTVRLFQARPLLHLRSQWYWQMACALFSGACLLTLYALHKGSGEAVDLQEYISTTLLVGMILIRGMIVWHNQQKMGKTETGSG
jgi:hypothetical protein